MYTTSLANQRAAQWRRALLIAMPLLALVPRLWIVTHSLYPTDISLFDTGFGFGNYARSLAEDGSFRACSSLPFNSCTPGICTTATRMPGIPLLLVGLTKLVGTQAVAVALAKCVLLGLLSAMFLAVLSMDTNITTPGVAILYALYFGPQALKHGAALDYEEGVLLDLSLCLAIALCYVLRPEMTSSPRRRAALAFSAVAIATAMYFMKTTALLTLLAVLAIVITSRSVPTGSKLAGVGVLAAMSLAWGAHNLHASGAAHLGSSWNGENLYRGYDSGALVIYPEISLDRIFDSSQALLDDGRSIPLGNYKSRRCFDDEWVWSSTYSDMARSWVFAHPYSAAIFLAKKIWVALVEVRHTPKYVSATDKIAEESPMLSGIMVAWMTLARIVFIVLVWRVSADLWAGRNRSYAWVLVLLLAACAPYMIVFAYQRHMIPVLELAGGLLAVLYHASPAASRVLKRDAESIAGAHA